MNRLIRVVSEFAVPAKDVWTLLKRRDTFVYVTRGLMRYDGAETWPECLLTPDVSIHTTVHPFHCLPGSCHCFRVVRVDEEQLEIHTEEFGNMIQVWNHSMKVEPVSHFRCRYTDRVELDAGTLTPMVYLAASLFYHYRHFRWRRMLATRELSPHFEARESISDACKSPSLHRLCTGSAHSQVSESP